MKNQKMHFTVTSPELESFVTRLLKCMEYIDMFVAGSEDVMKLDDKIDEQENHYAELALCQAKLSSSETVTPAELQSHEDSVILLHRDLVVMKCLLHKLADVALGARGRRLDYSNYSRSKSFDRKSTGSGSSAFQIPSMVARATELETRSEELVGQLNEGRDKRNQPRIFLQEKILEQYSSLQVQTQYSLEDLESGTESDNFMAGDFDD